MGMLNGLVSEADGLRKRGISDVVQAWQRLLRGLAGHHQVTVGRGDEPARLIVDQGDAVGAQPMFVEIGGDVGERDVCAHKADEGAA